MNLKVFSEAPPEWCQVSICLALTNAAKDISLMTIKKILISMLIIHGPNSQFPLFSVLDTLKRHCLKKQFGLWTNPIWEKGK